MPTTNVKSIIKNYFTNRNSKKITKIVTSLLRRSVVFNINCNSKSLVEYCVFKIFGSNEGD